MSNETASAGTLTIPNGTKPSEEIDFTAMRFIGPVDVLLIGPAALTGTVTVQVAEKVGGTFANYQDVPGTDTTVAAGKAIMIKGIVTPTLRVNSGTNEGADRVFNYRVARTGFGR